MILPIYIEPHAILHQPTQKIEAATPELHKLADDMRETMHNAIGIGLAAPQIGQSIAMCVIELSDPEDPENGFPFTALLNPRVTWRSKEQSQFMEACLSIPGVEGLVKRPERVRVKAHNLEGDTLEITADGLLARVLQHEIDHLNGIVFTSYVSKKKLQPRPLVEYPQLI